MHRTPFYRRATLLAASTFLLATSLACGASSRDAEDDPATGPTEEEAAIRIVSVTYGTALDDHFTVSQPVERFTPRDPLAISIVVGGRPQGILTARVDVYGQILEDQYDLAQVNAGVVWSVGTNTIVGGTFVPDGMTPQGHYETVLLHDGVEVGRYPFEIGPPEGAIETVIHMGGFSTLVLANGCVGPPPRAFHVGDTISFGMLVDVGDTTNVRVYWHQQNVEEPIEYDSLISNRNQTERCFTSSQSPDGGWPAGSHHVTVMANGEELARYPFTVTANP